MRYLLILSLLVIAPAAAAGSGQPKTEVVPIPVYEGDIDRPYEVVGQIKDNLRKELPFMPNPSKEKIFAEIWERAKKMGADAVINAHFGPTKSTPFNNGRTPISGTAIKFTDGGS
jgi:hypothetical protein